MRKKLFICILILLLSGCNLPTASTGYSPIAVSQLLVTADPFATPTPTPFQPLAQTQTVLATSTPTPLPLPFEPGDLPKDQVRILVLGSDYRPTSGFRTDIIIFLVINPTKGTVSAVSFPRDLYVEIPGYGVNRINTAFPHGFDVMANTLHYNFGIRPDYYIMTNFDGFRQIVDSLGGIDVDTAKNLTDKCKLPIAVDGYCSLGPGVVHMNGDTALWYVRSRYSTSDLDRGRRAQEVLKAIFYRFMQLDAIKRLPELYGIYINSVETNLTLDVILPLAKIAPQLMNNDLALRSYSIGANEVTPYKTEDGAQVLLPNQAAILEILRIAFTE